MLEDFTNLFKGKEDFDKKKEELFSYLISPSRLKIKPDSISINEMQHKIVKIIGYPRTVEDGWLRNFLNQNENYDLTIDIDPIDIQTTLAYLHNQIISQKSDLYETETKGNPNPALEVKLKDTKRLFETLYKGEEKLFKISFYVDNKEDSIDKVNELLEKCKSNLNALLMIPKTTDYEYNKAFRSILPIGIDEIEVDKEFTTKSLAASFPFISTSDHKKQGILFAHDTITKNPIFIDFEELANKHFFILGVSGSGKSYTAKYLLKQLEVHDDSRIYILDPNSEYTKIVSKMKGKTIEITQDSDSMINVFDFQGMDYASKMMQLIAVYDIIVDGLSESQKGVLSDVLIKTYLRKGITRENEKTWTKTPPTFKDVHKIIEERLNKSDELDKSRSSLEAKSYEVLLNRTKMYIKGGLFEFMDTQTTLDMKTKVVSFDLSKLPQPVKPLLMFIVLDFIVKQIKKDKENKVLLVDEGWSLLKSKEAENYVLEFVKNSRRFGCSVGFVTQDLEDLLASEGGKGILNMTQTKILMRQNTSNIDLLTKYLKLNDYEKDSLISCDKGYGILITGNKHYKFFIQTSTMMHDLITTNPVEQTKKKKVEAVKESDLNYEDRFDSKNYYILEKGLNDDEKAYRVNVLKWKATTFDIWDDGNPESYFVRTRLNESPEHALLSYAIDGECHKYSDVVVLSSTKEPDVVVFTKNGRKIGFEVETGSGIKKIKDLNKKIEKNEHKYDEVYFVVTSSDLEQKYKEYGKTIPRKTLKEQLKQILG
ncbi:Uncharacterised protein [uncultured archaeon]|nr:Uncharacterised protein [uncultured archaeon]